MARRGGLRSPPPNGGFGGRGGGKKEGKHGNHWQVLVEEEAGGGEPAAQGGRLGYPSKSPGIGRFSAAVAKGAVPLGAWEGKGIKPLGSSRPGKENVQGSAKDKALYSPMAVAMDVQVTKYTIPEGKFSPGVTSLIVKSAAVRELIMTSIGMTPPVGGKQLGGLV
ncbi:hypothetical protein KFK09_017584 [Dendrobium nobile]|uniref:Uncharacterized protein n=1 Tax=Dendrobium nobile TaxID=94219 RepID=A0A8T3B1P8_DENNO|nr:hypothetical protein KFK09_017584 [Dendrobium nobile]